MNFDLTLKVVMAVAGLIGGIAQACVNGKTLIKMADRKSTRLNSSHS